MSQRLDGSGRIIGLLSSQVPRELLYALGCTPVRVFPTAARPTAAEAYLPRNFCALTRLILASMVEEDDHELDAVIFADDDDAARRLHDVWPTCVPVPVWGFVEVPRRAGPLAVRRYADILARLTVDLEVHAGQRLTADALRRAIALYNEQRRLLADLRRSWLAGLLDTATYRRLRQLALTRDPATANERLRVALSETAERNQASPGGASPVDPQSPRLLLLGELAAPAGLVRLVEAQGARVVAEDSDLDERAVTEPVPADAETVAGLLAALAQAYLSRPPGPRRRDLPGRLAHLSRLVTQRRVTGAICAYSKFCDLYLAEFPVLSAHLKQLGVPLLLLELEDEAISGQHRTRVEAFLEMQHSDLSASSTGP